MTTFEVSFGMAVTAVSDEIRAAVINSDRNLSQLADTTGINKGRLSRFVRGERGLSMEAIDTLADYFGFRLSTLR